MIDLIIVGLLVALLGYASRHDLKHKEIEMWVIWFGIVLACLYYLSTAGVVTGINNIDREIEIIAVLFFTAVIWGLPTLFGFGIGDFILFMVLGVFLGTISEMWNFYAIFIVIWLIVSLILVLKDRKKIDRNFLFHHEYPLVPVITASFVIWFIGGLLF